MLFPTNKTLSIHRPTASNGARIAAIRSHVDVNPAAVGHGAGLGQKPWETIGHHRENGDFTKKHRDLMGISWKYGDIIYQMGTN